MIAPAEIQRTSAALGVSPDVVEHDYVLGCYLNFLGQLPEIGRSWVFKGGTSLAKCHFTHYRFSEDLDFTLEVHLQKDALADILNRAGVMTQSEVGIRLDVRPILVDVIEDDYGKESFEAKLYYEGVWRRTGSPRAIRVHANRDETLAFPTPALRVHHSYSDAPTLPPTEIRVYALEEIATEKLRALAGQRKYAVARDIYDIWSLSRSNVKMGSVIAAFRGKCEVRGMNPSQKDAERLVTHREEYEVNWKNNLEYQIPADLRCSFAEAWDVSHSLLEKAVNA